MKEKIDLIVKINDYLNANLIQKNLHLSDLYSLLRYLNFNNTSDGLAVRIVLEPEPKLEISTWDESYHNGSYYNHKFYYFKITENICNFILDDLQKQYQSQEFDRLLKEENKIKEDAIRAKIIPANQRFS